MKKTSVSPRFEKGLVSIIIPTYNYGPYLRSSIESALQQTYSKTEIIVVDDGSTDDTKAIAKRYPVKYVFQNNQGVSVAMNNGVMQSKGQFFITMGADDMLGKEYVTKTMSHGMSDKRIGFVYTGATFFGECDKEIAMPRKLHHRFSILAGGWIGVLGAALMRREAFESLDAGFDPALPAYEDLDLCTRLCLKGWKPRAVFEPLYFYRKHKTEIPHRHPEYSSSRDVYCAKLIDRKFWYGSYYRRLLALYNLLFERFFNLTNSPSRYLLTLNRNLRTMKEAKSFPWHNSINREKAVELAGIIISENIDILRAHVAREPLLWEYHERQLSKVEADFLELMKQDYSKS